MRRIGIAIGLLLLLNGVCPQQQPCQGGCQQGYAQPQSVVLTVPMQQLVNPNGRLGMGTPVITASGPCCQQNPQVQSVAWVGGPSQAQWNPSQVQPAAPANYQTAIYNNPLQPSTNYTYNTPGGYPASPQGNGYNAVAGGYPTTRLPVTNYNSVNQGYPTTLNPTTSYNGVNNGMYTTSPQGNVAYNNVNQGYSTPVTPQNNYNQANQGFVTAAPGMYTPGYNTVNQDGSTPVPGGVGTGPTTGPSSYNAVNGGFQNGQSQGNNYNAQNSGAFAGTQQPIAYNDVNQGYTGANTNNPNNNYYNAVNAGLVASGAAVGAATGTYNGVNQPSVGANSNAYNNPNSNYNTANAGFNGASSAGSQTGTYNNVNQGFPSANNNVNSPDNNYNAVNAGTIGAATGAQAGTYNDANQGYATNANNNNPNNNYNAPNANAASTVQGGQTGTYNEANQGYPNGNTNNNNGDYVSTFEGTFQGPANPQPNDQGNYDQGQGYNGPNEQFSNQYPNQNTNQNQQTGNQGNVAPMYPSPEMNQGQTQPITAEGSYQGQAVPQPNNQGNDGLYQGQYQDQGQFGAGQTATQAPFDYNTVNPNGPYTGSSGYPVTATAGYSPQNGDYVYSTPYNPNAPNAQGPTTVGPSGVNVSPINDQNSQFQTTQYPGSYGSTNGNNNFGAGAAAGAALGAAGAAAGSMYGATTTVSPFPSSQGSTRGQPSTATPYGQDGTGQFVQSTSNGGPSSQFPTSTTPTPFTTQYPGGSTFGVGGTSATTTLSYADQAALSGNQNLDGGAISSQHSDMNYQYSKGVDGGTTMSPQFYTPQQIGSTQAFTSNNNNNQLNRDQAFTNSPFGSTAGPGGVGNRQYDHGDMNAQYGQYDSQSTGNPLPNHIISSMQNSSSKHHLSDRTSQQNTTRVETSSVTPTVKPSTMPTDSSVTSEMTSVSSANNSSDSEPSSTTVSAQETTTVVFSNSTTSSSSIAESSSTSTTLAPYTMSSETSPTSISTPSTSPNDSNTTARPEIASASSLIGSTGVPMRDVPVTDASAQMSFSSGTTPLVSAIIALAILVAF